MIKNTFIENAKWRLEATLKNGAIPKIQMGRKKKIKTMKKTIFILALLVIATITFAFNLKSSSINLKSSGGDHVYICTSGNNEECCKAVVLTSRYPTTSGCCPRTDGKGCSSGHRWKDCGESGNRNYQCSGCGITVRTKYQPDNSCCPVRGCGNMHFWREIK